MSPYINARLLVITVCDTPHTYACMGTQVSYTDARAEVKFVHPVSPGGSVNFLPAV